MAITIDYLTNIINIPKADTQFVETNINTGLEVREINIDTFGKALADVQDDSAGMWAPTAFSYTPPATIGGIQLAPVLLILSPYTITFEDGQYAVGLIGGNTNMQDFVNVNQVSVRPNNSAGNTFSSAVNSQSFSNASVYINTTGDGEPGAAFPIGTPPRPSDNYSDALIIANREKLNKFHINGNIVFPNLTNISGLNFESDTPLISILVMSNVSIDTSVFNKVGIVGSVTGRASFDTCSFSNYTGAEGLYNQCGFIDTVQLSSVSTENIIFRDSFSVSAGTTPVVFDCNGTVSPIHFRGWNGGAKITNFNGGGSMSMDVSEGSVEIDSSCTSGVILIRGDVDVVDNSGVGCTVLNRTTRPLSEDISIYSKKASEESESANLKL